LGWICAQARMVGVTMPRLKFLPPVTVSETREAGEDFGFASLALSRPAFEEELVRHLVVLEELLTGDQIAANAIANFDQGAWNAWEVGKGWPSDDTTRCGYHRGCHQGAC
jgi:hypothetical protein